MNMIASIHTYLVISFLITVWMLAKFAYKKLDDRLSKDVNEVKDLLENLGKKKIDSEKQIKNLKEEIIEASDHITKSISDAGQTAKAITDKSNREISNLIEKKQAEYEISVQKMKKSLSVEMQNKLVDVVIQELVKKLKESREDRDFQNASIENSLEMLEDFLDKKLGS